MKKNQYFKQLSPELESIELRRLKAYASQGRSKRFLESMFSTQFLIKHNYGKD